MPTTEASTRQTIDAQLAACGWVAQDRAAMNLYAGWGVAVREFPLETGYADYLQFVDQRAARLRQVVLKRAFEGQLVAQNSEDEPAETLLERIRASGKTKGETGPKQARLY